MKKLCLLLVGGLVIFGLCASSGMAMLPFKKSFENRYVKDSKNKVFEAAFKEAGCFTCHVKGEKKTSRNAYGEALSKLIGGDAQKRLDAAEEMGDDAKDAEMVKILKQLDDAFPKVENEKSPSGPTFGEVIKKGKLPASN